MIHGMQNRTSIPTELLYPPARSMLSLFHSILFGSSRRALFQIMGRLPLKETFQAWQGLTDSLLLLLEKGMDDIGMNDISRAESTAFSLWQSLSHPDSEFGDGLQICIDMLRVQFEGIFPTSEDGFGFPIPMPKPGENEAIWAHVIGNESALEAHSQEYLGISAAELREPILKFGRRFQALAQGGDPKAQRRLRSYIWLYRRSWPIVCDLELIGDILCDDKSGDLVADAAFCIERLGANAGSLEARLTEKLGGLNPRTSEDPDWYACEDIPNERFADACRWEALLAIVREE